MIVMCCVHSSLRTHCRCVVPHRNCRQAVTDSFFPLFVAVVQQQENATAMLCCRSIVTALLDCAHGCYCHPTLHAQAWKALCWLPNIASAPVWVIDEYLESLIAVVRAKPEFFRSSVGFRTTVDAVIELGGAVSSVTVKDVSATETVATLSSPVLLSDSAVNPFSSPLNKDVSISWLVSPHRRSPAVVHRILQKASLFCFLSAMLRFEPGFCQSPRR